MTRRTISNLISAALLGTIISIVGAFGTSASAAQGGTESAIIDVYERVSPSVVNITASNETRDSAGRRVRQESTGSGFVIDDKGHVVTNRHVIADARRLDVTLPDGGSYIGEMVASDGATDLALLRIQAPAETLSQLGVATLGDSGALRVGQTVVAIGNPFGLERSASVGIVSSLGRTRPGTDQRMISNMIQTDAAINPGNSGGPLLNLSGEVIGINEQIEARAGSSVGVGFAIPVNTLKRHLPDLMAGRTPSHAWLGITGTAITPTLAERLELPVRQGVILTTTPAGGPAAAAGLVPLPRGNALGADIIVAIDGRPVRNVADVAGVVDGYSPGDSVAVRLYRGGEARTIQVVLGVWDESATRAP